MRAIAIGDKIFVNAFRLVGADGVEVSGPREMLDALRRALESRDVGLILLSDNFASEIESELAVIKGKYSVPLIYELPSPGGSPREIDYMQMVKEMMSS
ncbi:MAG: V-type ATP synthase subunit F [Conexivisphaera sp.]